MVTTKHKIPRAELRTFGTGWETSKEIYVIRLRITNAIKAVMIRRTIVLGSGTAFADEATVPL